MTFQEVKRILEDTNFDFDCCSIFNGPMVKLGDGVVVIKDSGKYKVFLLNDMNPLTWKNLHQNMMRVKTLS